MQSFRGWRAFLVSMLTLLLLSDVSVALAQEPAELLRWQQLVARYIQESPSYSPIAATGLGDHRFDHELEEVSDAARGRWRSFLKEMQHALLAIDRSKLSRDYQADYALLKAQLAAELWSLDRLEEWAWNPIAYTQMAGGAVYSLMARDFAPLEQRLLSVSARLEKLPRLLEQVRATLQPHRVPPIHVETAIKQNGGVISILKETVHPHLGRLSESDRQLMEQRIDRVVAAVDNHQQWLEKELLPNARGNYQLGKALFDEKLAHTLQSTLTRAQIKERAEFELSRVRREMYTLAVAALNKAGETVMAQPTPSDDEEQQMILRGLDLAYAEVPPRDGIVAAAKASLELTTAFVREKDLVTIPPDPVEIIVMPEFQRGVSVAYCDSPGPLDVGQKTFYAVAPLPEDWSEEQCRSFLREYNTRSIHNLTVHEAMPGHFLQLAHANRSASTLRALLSSGVFVEGWGSYTEQMMSEEGFLKDDPLMRLITLKWYLRVIANSLLDQAIHVDGITREAAMKLMTERTFQQEREAAGKWIRAQVTAAQLSTYFVGVQEHRELRAAATAAWKDNFRLKDYHDKVISFGSPSPKLVKALLLNEPIPE